MAGSGKHFLHFHTNEEHFVRTARVFIRQALNAGAQVRYHLPPSLLKPLLEELKHHGIHTGDGRIGPFPTLDSKRVAEQTLEILAGALDSGFSGLWLVWSHPQSIRQPTVWYPVEKAWQQLCTSHPLKILCSFPAEPTTPKTLTRVYETHDAYYRDGKEQPLQRFPEFLLIEEVCSRARQQAALAELSQQALREQRLDRLLQEATRQLADVLDVDYTKVLELLPGEKSFRLRAGVGWSQEDVGSTTLSAGSDSQAGFTLLTDHPIIVEDLRAETRFHGPSLLHEYGVVSGMSVIIPGRDGPFGVLGVHTTTPRLFTPDDVNFLQSVANVLAAAIQRKAIEDERREGEARFRLLVEEVRDYAISMLDPYGHIISWNKGVERIMGYTQDEIVGRHFSCFYPGRAHREGKPDLLLKQAATAGRAEDEGWRVRKDGSRFWGYATFTALRDESGTLRGFAKITRDMTAQHQLENALRAANQKLNALIEASPLPIIALDLDSRVTDWNPAAAEVFGWRREEILGHPLEILGQPASRNEWQQLKERLRRDGAMVGTIVQKTRKDGSEIDLRVSAAPILDAAGSMIGVMVLCDEVTTRSRLLRLAGHEILNPLTTLQAILGLLEQRLQGNDPLPDLTPRIRIAQREAKRVSDFIQDTFHALQVEQGEVSLRREPLNIRDLARTAFNPYKASHDNHVFTVRGVEGPPLLVLGDCDRLEQVLRNLIRNAIKYSPDGGTIELSIRGSETHALLTLRDEGVGISEDQLERIFDHLYRAPNLGSRDPGGMGLGLFLCREIVQRHGGRIWAECNADRGATFYVELPRYMGGERAPSPSAPPRSSATTTSAGHELSSAEPTQP